MTTFATGHVGLNVTDLERSQRFYEDVFGWEVKGGSADGDRPYVFLGDADSLVLTLWQQSDGSFGVANPGLHHLAFEVADIHAVEQAEKRIREAGGKVHHGGIVPHFEGAPSGGVFFDDPDGIRLEIYAPGGADQHGVAPAGEAPTCGFF